MRYILDFDWTLFDNGKVRSILDENGRTGDWRHVETWKLIDPRTCFYEDVMPWLKSHAKEDLHILTAYQGPDYSYDAKDFQKVKVERSGISECVGSVTFTMGEKKDCIGDLLVPGSLNVFLDDTPEQLFGVKEKYPNVLCVRMMRENAPNALLPFHDSEIPSVTSMTELDAIIEKYSV